MTRRVHPMLVLLCASATALAGDLDLASARQALDAAERHAAQLGAPGGAIAVVDAGGHPVALGRLDGSFPAAADVAFGKARTAALFRKPTRMFEDIVNGGRITMTTLPALTGFTPLKGGVPLMRDGEVLGAIGVSGAASADQDDAIAEAGAAALAGKAGARP